jgi:quinol-cytochrome oxidoreductase complex cytochrome b subunit
MIKTLLIVTAIFEILTGLALLASPSRAGVSLTRAPLDSAAGVIVARVAGAALLAIGVACWLARDVGHSPAGRALIGGLLTYNVIAAAVLGFAGMASAANGPAVWPGAAAHLFLAVFCIAALMFG